MIRKALIALLTLAAVGTVGLYVASYIWPGAMTWGRVGEVPALDQLAVAVHRGTVWIVHSSIADHGMRPFRLGPNAIWVERIARPPLSRDFTTMAKVPLAVVFVVCAAYPAVAFVRGPVRRWRRRRRRLCVRCGYDLTGNTSGVCSECGKEIARA